ncbi:transposase [Sedimentitalea sp. XS_ASV28]
MLPSLDPSQFRSARQFAAWLGLVPRQNSSGGKDWLGRITKMGGGYLRKLLVVGATAVLRRVVHPQTQTAKWIRRLLEESPPDWLAWHWRTKPRGSSGPSCRRRRSTSQPEISER